MNKPELSRRFGDSDKSLRRESLGRVFRERQQKWPRCAIDVAAVTALVLLAVVVVVDERNPYATSWELETFYQRHYAPVVMSACGQGWYSVGPSEGSALQRFLRRESDSFSCDELPAEIEKLPPNFIAVSQLYLFKTVEWAWRLSGEISWSTLRPLLGLMCGLVSAVTYGIFRLGMSPLLAIPAALTFFPYHLPMAPYLRDFAKAPFILASILLMGLLVRGSSFSTRRILALAAAAGLVVGVGLGFRPDLLIVAPPIAMTIALFLPGRLRDNLRTKLLAIALFAVLTAAVYRPIWSQEARRHGTSHVTLLGFSNRITEGLGLRSAIYDWEHVFSDSWVDFQIKSHAYFGLGITEQVEMYTESYEQFGMQVLFDRYAHYPADTLVRAYAAVLHFVPMPAVFGFVVLVLFTFSKRQALFLFLALLYFTGYPSLQFDLRHYFHLEFVPMWLLGFTIQGSAVLAWRALGGLAAEGWQLSRERAAEWSRRAAPQIGAAGVVVFAAFVVPLMFARAYQRAEVERVFERYESAELQALASEETLIEGQGLLRLAPAGLLTPIPTASTNRHAVGYLVVAIGGEGCAQESVTFSTRYEVGSYKDFCRTVEVDVPAVGSTKIFAPIYSRDRSNWGDSPFLGVDVAVDSRACLQLHRVKDLARLPPMLFVRLPPDWRERTLYQSLIRLPGRRELRSKLAVARFRWNKILGMWTSG